MTTTSLASQVHALFKEKKPELAEIFQASFVGKFKTDKEEVVALNRYFRQVLLQAPIPTQDERGCLIDDLAPATWLKYFRTHALPTMVRFDLPKE